MRLIETEIDRYGPLKSCYPTCAEGITVIEGPNEAGKTLYLEALLQLLEPDMKTVMSPSPRVDGGLAGRVLAEWDGEIVTCDGETSLCAMAGIEPAHLESIFVVRDSDLELPAKRRYYTGLIEHLGDIHTTEIAAIQEGLTVRGRLTDKTRQLSQQYDDAKTVYAEATALKADVEDYIVTVETAGLDDLNARRLATKRDLRIAEETYDQQRIAQRVAEHARLNQRLETYRIVSENLEALESVDRQTLEDLDRLEVELNRDQEERDRRIEEREEAKAEVDELERQLIECKDDLAALERREPTVEEAKSALEAHRQHDQTPAAWERQLTITSRTTPVSLLGAAIVGVAGIAVGSLAAIGLGVGLLLVGFVSLAIYLHANGKLSTADIRRKRAIERARDAGFSVESSDEIAAEIATFETDLEGCRHRSIELNQQLSDRQHDLADQIGTLDRLEAAITEKERERDAILETAGVDGIEEYREAVSHKERLDRDQSEAARSLIDRFGEPESVEPGERVDRWEADLARLVEDVSVETIDPAEFDEAELARAERDVETYRAELGDLEDRLADHLRRLDDFADAARNLTIEPFIGKKLRLKARTKAGLETLVGDIDRVIDQIDRDREFSLKALEIFDAIDSREAQKLTELFDPSGPASSTFAYLTDGRYSHVAYDVDAGELVVEQSDGQRLGVGKLSQGTRDQLYFASRISLADRLLGNEPGFLLLDDPLLAADPDRLRKGFESLCELEAAGWQILYLTAKGEVGSEMVAEFDLPKVHLPPLSSD